MNALTRRLPDLSQPWSLSGALLASALAIVGVGAVVLYGAGGWEYYRTPLAVRAYAPGHAALRPSGAIGHSLGIVGLAMMLVPVAYSIRKKWSALSRLGSMKAWLEVHIFCGIVGPVLITFHAALKFNGLISVAYWSMMAVMLSGFVGRYLYVRMPRSIRGAELSYEEILGRATAMKSALEEMGLSGSLTERLENLGGNPVVRAIRLHAVRRNMIREGVPRALARDATHLAVARESLLRRLGYLQRTRRLFAMWHMFHQPLVYLMFAIVLLHIGLAIYLGYAFFLQR